MNANKMNLMLQRLYIPVTQFSGLLPYATASAPTFTVTKGAITTGTELGLSADATTATVNNNTIASTRILSTNTPVGAPTITPTVKSAGVVGSAGKLIEIGTTGLVGLLVDTAGDDVAHMMPIPSNWDRSHQIKARVIWSSEAAAVGNRTITWKIMHKALTLDSDAIATPSTVLDTAIAADAPIGTAKTLQATAWGIINAGKFPTTDEFLAFLVEMDAFHTDFSENKYLVGVQFEFTPKLSREPAQFEAREYKA